MNAFIAAPFVSAMVVGLLSSETHGARLRTFTGVDRTRAVHSTLESQELSAKVTLNEHTSAANSTYSAHVFSKDRLKL